eukprot:TRINITY_DN8602_c0_g1_i1.p2 TRINITY_DN8602_c0_g1~~TRINITY_DN8602_c0_g1_i1.p2  ORF type:complete len:217 (+),score=61.21 TRINITY_DN8602_c0_g1_i1:851-1501(+)
MTLSGTGGDLHGTWNSETAISSSDRRLKQDISPLELFWRAKDLQGDEASWVLRQLRPVSYKFKKGADRKHVRFGFLADDLEQVLPDIIRNLERKPEPSDGASSQADEAPLKAVVYQDLIAVLTFATKKLQHRLADLEKQHQKDQKDNQDTQERVLLLERQQQSPPRESCRASSRLRRLERQMRSSRSRTAKLEATIADWSSFMETTFRSLAKRRGW